MKIMAALTKSQLATRNAELTKENLALRTQLDALRTTNVPAAPKCTVHDYADFVEARDNCKRLAMSELGKRYVFTQRGISVIARMRA